MRIYTILSVICIVICIYFMPMAQKESYHIPEIGVAEFEIQISISGDGYQMKCLQGCRWKEIGFASYYTLPWKTFYGKSIVDANSVGKYQSGLFTEAKPKTHLENDEFAFIVQRTDSGFELEGIKGTAWQSLKFECDGPNCVSVISAEGLVIRD